MSQSLDSLTPPTEVDDGAYETSWDLVPTDMSWVQEIEGYDNGSMPGPGGHLSLFFEQQDTGQAKEIRSCLLPVLPERTRVTTIMCTLPTGN